MHTTVSDNFKTLETREWNEKSFDPCIQASQQLIVYQALRIVSRKRKPMHVLIYVHYQQIHADDNLHTVVILVTKLHYVHNDFHKQVLGHIYKVIVFCA